MDLNRIHYFFKAVEYKNFTQAANACHIGQTTMSKYIAVLEQELQTQLFIREHRTLTLTKQGKHENKSRERKARMFGGQIL